MEISKLNERITIEKNAVVTDAIGNHKNTWIHYFSCYAYASTYQAEEKESEVSSEERSVTFTVRWCSEAAAVTSTGFRVRFRGEVYDIESVDLMNYRTRRSGSNAGGNRGSEREVTAYGKEDISRPALQ